MSLFNTFNLPAELLSALTRMSYTTPTPIQEKAIPIALSGRDLIGSAQTGTGKTAAFSIPLICALLSNRDARALILAPTRELAVQIVEVLKQLTGDIPNFRGSLLIGGENMEAQRRSLRREPKVIVATPGRLLDHLRENRDLLRQISFLVLDEADRMLDMGFAPQLAMIRERLSRERQTLLFSATYPRDIAVLAKDWLENPERVAIGSVSQPVAKVSQEMLKIAGDQKNTTLLQELEKRSGTVLVFARTKRRTDRLATFLKGRGISVCHIHGDRSQRQRQDALMGFQRGRFRVLVATDIAARGLDVPHIEHVINYDLPLVAEDYLHRIGRTARAGRAGAALCLVSPEEAALWRAIQRILQEPNGMPSSGRDRPFSSRRPQARHSGVTHASRTRDTSAARSAYASY